MLVSGGHQPQLRQRRWTKALVKRRRRLPPPNVPMTETALFLVVVEFMLSTCKRKEGAQRRAPESLCIGQRQLLPPPNDSVQSVPCALWGYGAVPASPTGPSFHQGQATISSSQNSLWLEPLTFQLHQGQSISEHPCPPWLFVQLWVPKQGC